MKAFNVFLCMAMGLAVLIGATPTPTPGDDYSDVDWVPVNITTPFNLTTGPAIGDTAGYDPSYDYHNYSTVQIWIGRTPQTVGWVIGSDLYGMVWELLDHGCPDNSAEGGFGGFCHDPKGLFWQTTCVGDYPFGLTDCTTSLYEVYGQWYNDQIRRLLIGAVAGTLEALTTNQAVIGPSNCFSLGNRKACNVGDIVRVNMPPMDNGETYMHVRLSNSHTKYNFDCCDTRAEVDAAIDTEGTEITTVFPQWWNRQFTRDTRCIIKGWNYCYQP